MSRAERPDTVIDIAESHTLINDVLSALEVAGRTILTIAPLTNGYAAYLQSNIRETSSLGVSKSEELGYGYSYTGSVMIVSKD